MTRFRRGLPSSQPPRTVDGLALLNGHFNVCLLHGPRVFDMTDDESFSGGSSRWRGREKAATPRKFVGVVPSNGPRDGGKPHHED
eukprot:scaffold5325_cov183-Amphora_coffeaeformis.AAC.11